MDRFRSKMDEIRVSRHVLQLAFAPCGWTGMDGYSLVLLIAHSYKGLRHV